MDNKNDQHSFRTPFDLKMQEIWCPVCDDSVQTPMPTPMPTPTMPIPNLKTRMPY